MAILIPLNWLVILLATAKPAASSAALLMRIPDDKRSIDVCILSLALVAYVRAIKAPTLVLITVIF
jgi:hypothetical protein